MLNGLCIIITSINDVWRSKIYIWLFVHDRPLVIISTDELLWRYLTNWYTLWSWLDFIDLKSGKLDITCLGSLIHWTKYVCGRTFPIQSFRRYGKHSVTTNGGTWYLSACKFLKLDHHINSSYEKSIIERAIQYIIDRTECFDDYFSMQKKGI